MADKFVVKFDCASPVSYYMVQNGISPIQRLYIRNSSSEDAENVTVEVFSTPAFLLPEERVQEVFPSRANLRFDGMGKLSPLFMVAQDKRIDGTVTVRVKADGEVVAEETATVSVLAFDECNLVNPESVATFVRRTPDVNRYVNLARKKLAEWKVADKGAGYAQNGKNSVRNYFASCYSVLAESGFIRQKLAPSAETSMVTEFSEVFDSKIATPLELSLALASMLESADFNSIIGKAGEKWFVGCFLIEQCFSDKVVDDSSVIAGKTVSGANELSVIPLDALYAGEAFEKAEKSATAFLKKLPEIDFFVDVKRARIMGVKPLPARVKTAVGYDLVESKDYTNAHAPVKIKEYSADITGNTVYSREKQWERRLLELDLRNGLLNFRISQTAVKVLTSSLDDFVEGLSANKSFSLEARPSDAKEGDEKYSPTFDNAETLKPLREYVRYEYLNKKLHTVYATKEHEKTLLNLFRKGKTLQEESGDSGLYVCAGFLKWRENETSDFKYAPVLLYPVSVSKKGISAPVYTADIDVEDVQINCTLLEFLYQEFNMDMRGLGNVPLSDTGSILAVVSRIKKEISSRSGWSIVDDVFMNALSFTNYLMWHDVRHHMDKMKESPLIRSLIANRIDDECTCPAENVCTDNAYVGKNRMYLPISADSSQYDAIVSSLNGSFVLHGPPGTGKSQTITNIIVNNIVRGRRVLFVAEKMAALNVVYKRLKDIGVGDFCLELHSDKTHKTEVLSKIIHTLNLSSAQNDVDFDEKRKEIAECIGKLESEMEAMHKKRYLGFSLYEAMLAYLENSDAPDCLRIDNSFYEKLTLTSFNKHLDLLTELALRAKECGDIEKSPFRYIGKFDYDEEWREDADAILSVYSMELKHLKQYARELQTLFNMRTISLTGEKLRALNVIAKGLNEDKYVVNYFKNTRGEDNAKGVLESYLEARKNATALADECYRTYNLLLGSASIDEIKSAIARPSFPPKSVKKLIPDNLEKSKRVEFFEYLLKCEELRATVAKRRAEVAKLMGMDVNADARIYEEATAICHIYDGAKILFADCDYRQFEDACRRLSEKKPHILLGYYTSAYATATGAKNTFNELFRINHTNQKDEINSTIDYISNIAKNIDLIPSWCRYQSIVERCGQEGFDFVLEPLATGEITAEDVLRSFKKCVYYNFIRSELYLDDVLCRFSGLTLEETMQKFRILTDEYEKLTKINLYNSLVYGLPKTDTAGEHNLERVLLYRAEKTNMQGTTIRSLFAQIPEILKATCPCMLMSPVSVAQYLDIEGEKFDLVVFDEASQVPTSEAIGAIARGKNVIIVGDPEQLPPTTFFRSDYKDDSHYEVEDLESILDDCLAVGMPERHLLWHYRSNHESLIAFSNSMFYGNTLLTFPSPGELNAKVRLVYVDGVYERGGTKHNKKEADALVKHVLERLKNPVERTRSIGIVTFNTAQQNYIEDKLATAIHGAGLDEVAYDRDEPIFVKNLENVQGDERDVILFSVGYGPDQNGKLSLNFGPINQQGGYKRLNVAVTRARCEMVVFSSVTGNMIDLNRTDSAGVKALKAFLDYAEKGTDMLAISADDTGRTVKGLGENVAHDLKDRGLVCESNLGVSDFRIDVAVVDPRDKDKYILAIIIDSENTARIPSVRDRMTMQTKILKKLGWNTYNLWSINYYNNPRREINKIKELVSTLTEKKVVSKKTVKEAMARYKQNYKSLYIKPSAKSGVDYVMNFANEEAILTKIRAVIETESPVEYGYLLDKMLSAYCVPKTAKKAVKQIATYIEEYESFRQEIDGKIFYVDKPVTTFRPIDERVPRDLSKIHPDEILACARCAIEISVNLDKDDLVKEIFKLFNLSKRTKVATEWVEKTIASAISKGEIIVTPEGYCKV